MNVSFELYVNPLRACKRERREQRLLSLSHSVAQFNLSTTAGAVPLFGEKRCHRTRQYFSLIVDVFEDVLGPFHQVSYLVARRRPINAPNQLLHHFLSEHVLKRQQPAYSSFVRLIDWLRFTLCSLLSLWENFTQPHNYAKSNNARFSVRLVPHYSHIIVKHVPPIPNPNFPPIIYHLFILSIHFIQWIPLYVWPKDCLFPLDVMRSIVNRCQQTSFQRV